MFRKKPTGLDPTVTGDHELAQIVTPNTQAEGSKGSLPVYNESGSVV